MRQLRPVILTLAVAAMTDTSVLGGDILRLESTQVVLRYCEYEFAIRKGTDGVPRLDWDLYGSREANVIERRQEAVILENRYFRATLIPAMGRIRSFIHKPSGHEQLWINPAAIAIPARNDTGFWVTWGGVEHVLPRGEHGTSHALGWRHRIEEDSAARKAIRIQTIEPLIGLKHTVIHAAYPDRRYLETKITIENVTERPVRASHWTTALLAPGGRGEVTPRTEFVVPAERFLPADRPFNRWMHDLVGPARTSPLRFASAWRDIGDLMASPLEVPTYAAYCHEHGEAVFRSFDLEKTPGFNIWTWGYPPSVERQREYTAQVPNMGYVEFWTGTVLGFDDDALRVLAPGERVSWIERMWAIAGVRSSNEVLAELQTRGE